MKILVWIMVAVVFAVPAIYLYQNPDAELTTTTSLLKDVLLLLLTIIGTYLSTAEAVRRQANNKWVPQARSACRTLLSLWADVQRLRRELSNLCTAVTSELPIMEQDEFKGARTALNLQCKAGASRLDSIGEYLTNSVADWENFIASNCEGDECAQISQELAIHKSNLTRQLAAADSQDGCSSQNAKQATNRNSPR